MKEEPPNSIRIGNVETQMRKGLLEYCILHVISQGENYIYGIFQQIQSAELTMVEGTLYPLIRRLRKEQYVQYRWHESSLGAPRKYYSLTKKGELFLEQLHESWRKLSTGVNELVGNRMQENAHKPSKRN